jgi:hypothetical protein
VAHPRRRATARFVLMVVARRWETETAPLWRPEAVPKAALRPRVVAAAAAEMYRRRRVAGPRVLTVAARPWETATG